MSSNAEIKDFTYTEKEINFSFESEDEDSYFEEPIYFGTEKVELNPPEEKGPIKPKSTRPLEVTKKTKAGQSASSGAAQAAERKVGPTSSKDVWASSSFAIRNSGSKAASSTSSSSSTTTQSSMSSSSTTSTSTASSSQSKTVSSISVSSIRTTTSTGSSPTSSASPTMSATHSVTPIPSASSFPALSAPSPKVQAPQSQYYPRSTQNDMKHNSISAINTTTTTTISNSINNDNERSIIREKRNKDFQNLIANEKKASKSPIRHSDTANTIGLGGNSNSDGAKWKSSRQGGYHNDRSAQKESDEKMKEILKQREEEEQRQKELRQSSIAEKMKRLDEKAANAQQQQQQQQQPPSPTEQPTKDPTSRVASFKIEQNSMMSSSSTQSVSHKKEEAKMPSPPSVPLPSAETELTMPNSSVKKLNIVKKSPSQHSSQSPSPAMQPQTPPPYTKPIRAPGEPIHSASPHKELQIKRNIKPLGGEHRDYQGKTGADLPPQAPHYRDYQGRQSRPVGEGSHMGSSSQPLEGRGRGMVRSGVGYEYRDHGDSQGRKGKSEFEVKVKDKEDKDAHRKPRGVKQFGADSSEYNSGSGINNDRRKGGNNGGAGNGNGNRIKYRN